ncbi:MAG: hypothetical protein K2J13_02020, partial [Clostridia bacterium]|nr:hypothetical protein [Clostridia bacterium]
VEPSGEEFASGLVDGEMSDVEEDFDMSEVYKQILPSLSSVGKYSFHTYFLAKAMTATSAVSGFGYAMAFFGIVLALAGLGSLLASWQYKKLAMDALESGGVGKASGKSKDAKQLDVKQALFKKDLFSVLKNNTMLIQAGMMCVLPPILVFFIAQMQSNIELYGTAIGVGVAELIIKLMMSSNTASILAFSRDGEGVLIYKTLPVNAKDIINAKIKTGLVFTLTTAVLSAIALAFVKGMNVLFVIGFLTSALIYGYASNRFCVYRDLKKPKIYWKNIKEITNNNFSSIVPMLFAFIPGVLSMAGTILVGTLLTSVLNQYVIALIYIVITLAVSGLYLLIIKSIYNFNEEEALQRVE